ncbi:MAG: type III secretion HpaP family protein [Pseudomonadota bacterium]
MSDNNVNSRKARIVRVGGVESSLAARKPLSEQDASRSGGRARPFGAPLQQPARFQKPAQQASKIAFEQAMAEVPGATLMVPAVEGREGRESVEVAGVAGILVSETEIYQDPTSAFIWEQLPQLELTAQENAPRWVNNAMLSPSDEEYAALGSYIAYMVDGFSVFCRMPSVEEGGNWHARLNMPQVVMPETVLDVSISRLHARLRFETDHRVSRELLSRCVEKLQAQVRTALDDAREVEVTVW